jgi:amino acid transporter
VVPWREFVPAAGQLLPDRPPPIAAMFIERLYGTKVASVFTVMVLWTALASCFALLLGYSRVPFAAARDGNFFSIFNRVHPVKKFPYVSLLFVGVMSILCTLLDLVTVINALLATRIIIQFIGQIGAIIWFRKKVPKANRPFRVWLYPLPLLVAFCGWIFLLSTIGAKTFLYAVSVVVAGAAVYLLAARKTGRWPFIAAPG